MADKQVMDGCTAAAHVAFAMSDVATIYPITPIASMGQTARKWGMEGRKNYIGRAMEVREMESELGAAGATHGAAAAGALATTFTASQGLMLMIPNMYKISGELLPVVFHVGSRSLATHALSIFGDHQDVMACRATGFAMLASSSVQETMDLAIVAHLAAVDGSLPVLHFFDGWRTSNEMSTINVIDYDTIFSLMDRDKIEEFRRRGLNPAHPLLRGSAQNPDVYFQNREASNKAYDAFPAVVQRAMDKVAKATGRQYHLFDYSGAADADRVIVIIGSGGEVAEQTAAHLNAIGYKVGVVKVRLYRPFDASALLAVLPETVKTIAVLDRTKEPGSQGEPLYQDVVTAVHTAGRDIRVIGGRYGLSSKDFTPAMVKAVYDNAAMETPKSPFTVGIEDDVTGLSLTVGEMPGIVPPTVRQSLFYGIGSDGTVGATKQIAAIIGAEDGKYAQAYFHYSAKKSGGYTVSQLRVGNAPVKAAYAIEQADYVFCNKDKYVRQFHLLDTIKPEGTFVLNSAWTASEMDAQFPAAMKRIIARRRVKFYNIDATAIAQKEGLGVRINTIMETVFFHLCDVMPFDKALAKVKASVTESYRHEGNKVVECNLAAIDQAVAALTPIDYPASWADATDTPETPKVKLPDFIAKVARPCMELQGDRLPVSLFAPDGSLPMGTTAYEKRRIAVNIPRWDVDKCVECTECSFVCPHATIRPVLMTADEKAAAPEAFVSKQAHGAALKDYQFRIQVYPEDCVGCGSCATICPGHALTMVPLQQEVDAQIPLLAYAQEHVTEKPDIISRFTVNGSQFCRPLLQFSGACGGCGETPYIKLLTQLFGKRMIIANATGCSSIWGANYPSNAYCTDTDGRGPAWANSLFEDNAEYGYGMAVATDYRREHARELASQLAANGSGVLKDAASSWLAAFDDPEQSHLTGLALTKALSAAPPSPEVTELLECTDDFAKKSIWIIGGDGWAYDIGFAGLDHVLATRQNVNIFVMDTECYSNTGGQTSKATPLGAVTKYSPDGKRTFKKDLGRMMMTYGTVYVASVALGANFQQTINALREAEAYDGPSIVIGYCPCINHGIRTGMSHAVVEQRDAVLAGYWPLYRYNPSLPEPLTVDYAKPDGQLPEFLDNEDRYADLKMIDPTAAATLRPALATRLDNIYTILSSTQPPLKPDKEG